MNIKSGVEPMVINHKALSTKLKTFCKALFFLQIFIFQSDFYSCSFSLRVATLAQTQSHSYWCDLCNNRLNPTTSARVSFRKSATSGEEYTPCWETKIVIVASLYP